MVLLGGLRLESRRSILQADTTPTLAAQRGELTLRVVNVIPPTISRKLDVLVVESVEEPRPSVVTARVVALQRRWLRCVRHDAAFVPLLSRDRLLRPGRAPR
jgi:hypothetical protein